MANYKNLYIVNGIRRSGNHAIYNWISGHIPSSITYKNNAKYDEIYKDKNPKNNEIAYYGLENHWDLMDEIPHNFYKEMFSADNVYFVNILRNPINNLASIMERGDFGVLGISPDNYVKRWRKQKDLYLNCNIPGVTCVSINFDLWSLSKIYRDELAVSLGFINQDLGRENVSIEGNGSSFDKMKFNGQASRMKVNERWRSHYKDPRFHKVITELKNDIEDTFGPLPYDIKSLIPNKPEEPSKPSLKPKSAAQRRLRIKDEVLKIDTNSPKNGTDNIWFPTDDELRQYNIEFDRIRGGKIFYDIFDSEGKHSYIIKFDMSDPDFRETAFERNLFFNKHGWLMKLAREKDCVFKVILASDG
jgi:hypothetical protein